MGFCDPDVAVDHAVRRTQQHTWDSGQPLHSYHRKNSYFYIHICLFVNKDPQFFTGAENAYGYKGNPKIEIWGSNTKSITQNGNHGLVIGPYLKFFKRSLKQVHY